MSCRCSLTRQTGFGGDSSPLRPHQPEAGTEAELPLPQSRDFPDPSKKDDEDGDISTLPPAEENQDQSQNQNGGSGGGVVIEGGTHGNSGGSDDSSSFMGSPPGLQHSSSLSSATVTMQPSIRSFNSYDAGSGDNGNSSSGHQLMCIDCFDPLQQERMQMIRQQQGSNINVPPPVFQPRSHSLGEIGGSFGGPSANAVDLEGVGGFSVEADTCR